MSLPYNTDEEIKYIPGGTTVCVECARSPMSIWVSSGDSGLRPNPKDVTWGECPMYMYSVPIFVRMGGPKMEGHLEGGGAPPPCVLKLLGEAPAIHDPELKPAG